MNILTSQQAQLIIERAALRASELQVAASIAIVDSAAHLLAFSRMDGAALGPIDVCQRKARTSALFRCDSGDFGKVIADSQLTGMIQSNDGLAAFPGGKPIIVNGQVIGAIGVSGGSAEQDHIIASFALEPKK